MTLLFFLLCLLVTAYVARWLWALRHVNVVQSMALTAQTQAVRGVSWLVATAFNQASGLASVEVRLAQRRGSERLQNVAYSLRSRATRSACETNAATRCLSRFSTPRLAAAVAVRQSETFAALSRRQTRLLHTLQSRRPASSSSTRGSVTSCIFRSRS